MNFKARLGQDHVGGVLLCSSITFMVQKTFDEFLCVSLYKHK
jgi:hypothetical protein